MRKKILNQKRLRLIALNLIVLTTVLAISVTPASAVKSKWDYWEGDVGPLSCSPVGPDGKYVYEIWWHFEGYFKIIKSNDDYYKDWANVDCHYYTIPDKGKNITGVSISAYIWEWDGKAEIVTYQGLFFKGIIIDSQTGDPIGDPIVDAGQIVIDHNDIVLEMRGHHPLTSSVGEVITDQLPILLV